MWLEYFAEVQKVAGSNLKHTNTGKLTVHPEVNGYLTFVREG